MEKKNDFRSETQLLALCCLLCSVCFTEVNLQKGFETVKKKKNTVELGDGGSSGLTVSELKSLIFCSSSNNNSLLLLPSILGKTGVEWCVGGGVIAVVGD